MKKLFFYLFIIIIFIVILFASCKKCDKSQTIDSIGSEMYSYIFLDSSIWIYRNLSSNIFDTVILCKMDHNYLTIDTDDKCIDLLKEFFVLQFNGTMPTLNNVSSYKYYIDYNGIAMAAVGLYSDTPQQLYNRLYQSSDSTSKTKYVGYYPALEIEHNVIYNIEVFSLPTKTADTASITYFYWAPSFGLVRAAVQNDLGNFTYWDLHESHLIYYK